MQGMMWVSSMLCTFLVKGTSAGMQVELVCMPGSACPLIRNLLSRIVTSLRPTTAGIHDHEKREIAPEACTSWRIERQAVTLTHSDLQPGRC